MTEKQVEERTEVGVTGDGEDCLLGLVEKVYKAGSGAYIEELRRHVVDFDESRGVAILACLQCPVVVELTQSHQGTAEEFLNFEQCKQAEVRARMRLYTNTL